MSTASTTPARRTPRVRSATRAPVPAARKALPAYGVGDGVLSFRHGLRARERGTLDKALEIVGRALREPGAIFHTPDAVKHYLQLQMAGEKHERFAVLFFDLQYRCIAFESMFNGTLTQTSVYPREVAIAAFQYGASAVVLAHNHPGGGVQPSRTDQVLTQTLKAALSLVDVRVLDHVIVGPKETLSMAEQGLM